MHSWNVFTLPQVTAWLVQTRHTDCHSSGMAQMQWSNPATSACNNHQWNQVLGNIFKQKTNHRSQVSPRRQYKTATTIELERNTCSVTWHSHHYVTANWQSVSCELGFTLHSPQQVTSDPSSSPTALLWQNNHNRKQKHTQAEANPSKHTTAPAQTACMTSALTSTQHWQSDNIYYLQQTSSDIFMK